MSGIKDAISAQLYLIGWKIVQRLPEKVAYKLFEKLGKIFHNRNGKAVKRLRSNLQVVMPSANSNELEEIVIKGISSYFRYWCDTFRFPGWSTQRIIDSVNTTNENLLKDPVAAGTGVIVALPHSGNWDHAGAYFCGMGFPLVTVAERLKPEALFNKFLEYRQNIGMEVLALDGRSMATLLQRAREGSLIALVADRDLSKSGVDVTFFDYPARMPAGAALLAIRTGIPLVTAYVSYTNTGIHIEFNEVKIPSDGTETQRVAAVVQNCADLFADGITKHPQDWHMLQRIWIDGDFQERTA